MLQKSISLSSCSVGRRARYLLSLVMGIMAPVGAQALAQEGPHCPKRSQGDESCRAAGVGFWRLYKPAGVISLQRYSS